MAKIYPRFYFICGFLLVVALIGIVFIVRDVQDDPRLILDTSRIRGPINAPIRILEYSDFQCPACARAAQIVHQMLEKYPYKIRLSFNHYPLKMHQWAFIAHMSSQCAAEQGKYWPYHDLLFEHQEEWSKSQDPNSYFKQYAKQLELDQADFTSCLDGRRTEKIVTDDVQKARDAKIVRTPTFIVNGERVIGGKDFEKRFEDMIRRELGLKEEEE